jgi:hypothetical protein
MLDILAFRNKGCSQLAVSGTTFLALLETNGHLRRVMLILRSRKAQEFRAAILALRLLIPT